MLLALIDGYHCEEHGGCYASNQHLAKKLQVKENTIVKSLVKLRKLGVIEDISFNGRKRVIRSLVGEFIMKNRRKKHPKEPDSSPKSESYSAHESQAECDLNHRQTVKKITPRSGLKSHPIYRDIKAYRKDPLSLTLSPTRKKQAREGEKKGKGREGEERGFFGCLEGIELSEVNKRRLCREYPESLVSAAVAYSQTPEGKPRTSLDRALFYYCSNPGVMKAVKVKEEPKSDVAKDFKEKKTWAKSVISKAQEEDPGCRVNVSETGVWFTFSNGPRDYKELVLYSDINFKSMIEHYLRKMAQR